MNESEIRELVVEIERRFPGEEIPVERWVSALSTDDAPSIRSALQRWNVDRAPTVVDLRNVARSSREGSEAAQEGRSGTMGAHWRETGFAGVAAAREAVRAAREGDGPARVVGSDT